MIDKTKMQELLSIAKDAKKSSYSPYSGFSVGAALLAADGSIYRGCNIENSAFSPTCCAERVAVFSAVADGKREFSAIAVVGDSSPCTPCGVCRQVLSEFCSEELCVIFEGADGTAQCVTLGELLPHSFRLEEKK